jgi:hypothetical protein
LSNVEITIKQTAAGTLPLVFGNIKSKNDGGLVYLKNGALEIDSSLIADISAGQRGGLIYTDDNVQITIKSSKFNKIHANLGGLIYSSGLITQTAPSTIAFTGPQTFSEIASEQGGGVFFFDHPKLDVDLNTVLTLSNCHTHQGNGGVFYIR